MKSLSLIMAVFVAAILQGSVAFHLAPWSSHLPDDPCSSVYCGNGTCTTTNDYPFFKCECNAGWKQPPYEDEFPFQPCVIPNCTIDYSCSNLSTSPTPAPSSHSRFKIPADPFNPCSYEICGGGKCVRKPNETLAYQCECAQGYANVMNWTWGFCARECELTRDCSRIGISVSNDTTTSNSSSSNGHGGLRFIAGNGALVSGSILATLMVLLFK